MKIISHRGNLNGPNLHLENSIEYIQNAINMNFIVEIDVRFQNNNLYLGHDFPQYLIDKQWIIDRSNRLLLHTKDSYALEYIIDLNIPNIVFFSHQNDDFSFISNGYIWTHNINYITSKSIIPLINEYDSILYENCYGICTDYPLEYRKTLNSYCSNNSIW